MWSPEVTTPLGELGGGFVFANSMMVPANVNWPRAVKLGCQRAGSSLSAGALRENDDGGAARAAGASETLIYFLFWLVARCAGVMIWRSAWLRQKASAPPGKREG
jgi:hypothetical protein